MSTVAHEPIAGTWIGGYELARQWTFLEAHFTPDAATLTGTIDMRFEGELGLVQLS